VTIESGAVKKMEKVDEQTKKSMEVRALNCPKDQWTNVHFKAMCLYKKFPATKFYQTHFLCSSSARISTKG
jgi:hypothetical protein